MSRSRKAASAGEVLAEPSGNGAGPAFAPRVAVVEDSITPVTGSWVDPRDGEIARLRADLNAAQMAANDANRLLAEVKAQRNAHADEIMLLRAQLKVAIEDGNNGWAAVAAAQAASGQTH